MIVVVLFVMGIGLSLFAASLVASADMFLDGEMLLGFAAILVAALFFSLVLLLWVQVGPSLGGEI